MAREFCRRNNLVFGPSIEPIVPIIDLTVSGLESFTDALGIALRENLIPLEEPTWALLRAMILRAFAHANCGLVCLATGSPASAEVMSRVILESALNVLYILEH